MFIFIMESNKFSVYARNLEAGHESKIKQRRNNENVGICDKQRLLIICIIFPLSKSLRLEKNHLKCIDL